MTIPFLFLIIGLWCFGWFMIWATLQVCSWLRYKCYDEFPSFLAFFHLGLIGIASLIASAGLLISKLSDK